MIHFGLSLFDIILIVLSSYRLTIMLIEEDGFLSFAFAARLLAFEVEGMTKYEAWKISLTNDSWQLEPKPVGHLGRVFSCIYCMSVWVGLGLPLVYIALHSTVFVFLFYALSVSALVVLIDKIRG